MKKQGDKTKRTTAKKKAAKPRAARQKRPRPEIPTADIPLRSTVDSVCDATGDAFFRSLAEHLADSLHARYVLVGELSKSKPDTVNTIIFLSSGRVVQNFEYCLTNTPCENVVRQEMRCYPSEVQKEFPDDQILVDLCAASYAGTPLFDSKGGVIGVMVVMDDKPIPDPENALSLIKMLSVRASAELERRQVEGRLRVSEEKFRKLIETAQEGVYMLDAEARATYVNKRAAQMLGYEEQDLLGRTVFDFVDESDRERARQSFERRKQGKKEALELRFRKKDGSLLWAMVSANPLMDTQGRFSGSFSMMTDITARKHMEESLLQTNRQLQILSRASQQVNAVLDIPVIMRSLVAEALELVNAAAGAAGLVMNGQMVFTEYNSSGTIVPIDYRFDEGYGVPGWVMKTREPYFTNNTELDPHVVPEIRRTLEFYNLIDVPILDRNGEIMGCFEIHNTRDRRPFTNHDVDILKGLAASAAVAIENTRIFEDRLRAEKDLKLFRELIDQSNDAIFFIDPSTSRFLDVNDRACARLGYSRDELTGLRVTDIEALLPDDFSWAAHVQTVKKEGFVLMEGVHRRKDGALFPCEVNVRYVKHDQQDYMVAIVRDTTDRRKAEEELRKREEKYRRLVESIEEQHFLYSHGTDGVFTYISPSVTRILGYTQDEFRNHYTTYLTDNPVNQDAMLRTELSIKGERQPPYEIEIFHKDGSRKWLYVSEVPVIAGDGKVIAVEGIGHDITERKKAEEGLKLSEARLKALLELSRMTGASVQEIATFVLDKCVELTGSEFGFTGLLSEDEKVYTAYALSDSVMKDCFIIERPLHFVVDEAGIWAEAVRKHQPLILNDYPAPHQRKKGLPAGHVPLTRLLSVPLIEGDRVVGLAALANKQTDYLDTDIQQVTLMLDGMWRHMQRRNASEELLKAQKLEAIGLLAGGLAHDFNNLLTGILGNIELAKFQAESDPQLHKRLDEALKSFYRARDLTHQLLTFSRGGEPVKKITRLEPLIRESAGFALRGSNVRCEFAFDPKLLPADLDEGQISQVIHNLVINACHAMPSGGIITIRGVNDTLARDEAPPLPAGRYVKISVEDKGTGIPPEHVPKIFDPYFTTKQTGSGLGLATTYSIIKKHDGHITVESVLGSGTKFHFYLPASEGPEQAAADRNVALLRGSGRVLVMDDEETVRQVAGDMLTHLGYEAEFAETGEAAVDSFKRSIETGPPIDAIIMDLTIPGGMGGLEAVSRVHALDPNIPVIVSSGYSNDPVMADHEKYGFIGVVAKPYKIHELSEALHAAVQKKREA